MNDPTRSIIEDSDTSGDVLVIAFGGVASKLDGLPPFEFFSVLAEQSASRVFVRDLSQTWYQGGVPGGRGNADDFTEPLRALIADRRPSRVVTMGVSAGAFGAIYFGCLLRVDHVLAFSPQTFTSRWQRAVYRETRWPVQTQNVNRLDQRGICRDVRPLVRAAARSGEGPTVEVHVGSQSAGDLRHARRLRSAANVSLTVHDAGHNTARDLRNRGELGSIILHAVEPRITP